MSESNALPSMRLPSATSLIGPITPKEFRPWRKMETSMPPPLRVSRAEDNTIFANEGSSSSRNLRQEALGHAIIEEIVAEITKARWLRPLEQRQEPY